MVRRFFTIAVFVACIGGVAWAALAILAVLGFHYAAVPAWVPLP